MLSSWFKGKAVQPLPTSAQSAGSHTSKDSKTSNMKKVNNSYAHNDADMYGYDDAVLEVGGSEKSSSHRADGDHIEGDIAYTAGRQSFSAPMSSRGQFLGSGNATPLESHNQSKKSSTYRDPSLPEAFVAKKDIIDSSYPPLPSFSQPSGISQGYPPLLRTFARLEILLAAQSPSLLDSLAPPLRADNLSLNSLLNKISPYSLPESVIESYAIHDGQDPYSLASSSGGDGGLFWGLYWMPMDRVEQEWSFWRRLEEGGGGESVGRLDAFSIKIRNETVAGTRNHPYLPESEAKEGKKRDAGSPTDSTGMNELVNKPNGHFPTPISTNMSSFPAGWVRPQYSHPGWLPLLTDHCGNYIGVDLDPPPPSASEGTSPFPVTYGQPGQVIAFGRELDQKVVLFPGDGSGGWGRFLAAFQEDLRTGGHFATLAETHTQDFGNRFSRQVPRKTKKQSVFDSHVDEKVDGTDMYDEEENGSSDDGLGYQSYLEGARYGEETEEGGSGQSRVWILRPEYQHWISRHGEGGLIGALAERSRRKWRSMGVGSRDTKSHLSKMTSVAAPNIPLPQKPALFVSVPSSPAILQLDDEPKSSVTVRPETSAVLTKSPIAAATSLDPTELTEMQADSDDSGGRENQVEVVLSPPSPTSSHWQSKEKFKSPLLASVSAPGSPDLLSDGRRSSQGSKGRPSVRNRHIITPKGRNKILPPPPAFIILPTMETMNLDYQEGVGFGIFEREDGIPLPRSENSEESPVLSTISNHLSSLASPDSPGFGSRELNTSLVALVQHNNGSDLELVDSNLANGKIGFRESIATS